MKMWLVRPTGFEPIIPIIVVFLLAAIELDLRVEPSIYGVQEARIESP